MISVAPLHAAARSPPLACFPAAATAQRRAAAAPAPARSAPIANLRYEVTFDSATAAQRTIKVARDVRRGRAGAGAALAPGVDPGRVRDHQLRALGQRVHRRRRATRPLEWDKLDYDTWRVEPARRAHHHRAVRLPRRHARQRDGLEPARFRLLQRHQPVPLSRGARLQLPRDGDGEDPAGLAGRDRDGAGGRRPDRTAKANYHDLVDMPFFVGRIDVDSVQVDGQVAPAGDLSRRRDDGARAGRCCGTRSRR